MRGRKPKYEVNKNGERVRMVTLKVPITEEQEANLKNLCEESNLPNLLSVIAEHYVNESYRAIMREALTNSATFTWQDNNGFRMISNMGELVQCES